MSTAVSPDVALRAADVALRIEHLSKTFPGTRALDDVSIDVKQGEIHCLLGGNGSGKSSLIKILAGVYHGDPGGIIVVGSSTESAARTSPEWARSANLRFVHQDLGVFDGLTVAENLAIGRGFPLVAVAKAIRWKALKRQTREVLARFSLDVSPDQLVGDLRPAERTMVAIARALQDQGMVSGGVLVLDEPTVSLSAGDIDMLLDALHGYAKAGQTILFVTHRLEEVTRIADRVTVLRDGKVVTTIGAADLTEKRLAELIVGRELESHESRVEAPTQEKAVLVAKGLCGGPLGGVSFSLARGEVLGVAGLVGSGRTELLQMLFGAFPVALGTVELEGRAVRFKNVIDAMDAGLALVPEDRSQSAFLEMDLCENLVAADVPRYWKHFVLSHRAEREEARDSMTRFNIRAYSDRQPFGTLSGGNQQRSVVLRWLRRKPKVLLLDEPTQGVDVEARAEIYELVRRAASSGSSVMVVTSDFEEMAALVDRVLVLARGTIAAELRSPDIEASRITELVLSASAARLDPPITQSSQS